MSFGFPPTGPPSGEPDEPGEVSRPPRPQQPAGPSWAASWRPPPSRPEAADEPPPGAAEPPGPDAAEDGAPEGTAADEVVRPPLPPQPAAPSWATSPRPARPPGYRSARVIALANQKGGVGKTTTVINLGAALAELDHRVLLVDMDPQGSLGVGLGAEPHRLEATVYNLLMADGTTVDDVVRATTQPGMHLLPANIDLAAAELLLVQEVAREQSLRRVLERVRYRYDYVLIDCPPSLGLLTINGLTAADGVVVPLECEYFALRGMSLLMETIEKVRGRLNPDLQLEGILATMVDTRTLHAREVLERVQEAFGELVFKTTINRTIRFAEAPVAGEPILRYDTESRGSSAYRDLAREVAERGSASTLAT